MYNLKHFKKFFYLITILCFILISTVSYESNLNIKNIAKANESINIMEMDYYEEESYTELYIKENLSEKLEVESTDKIEPTNFEIITTTEISTKNIEKETITNKETSAYVYEEISYDDDLVNIIKTYSVPKGHSFKSYTNYKLLSSNSPQGRLQTQAHTDSSGIRMVGEYYCAALGTYYEGNIGDKYLVTLEGGNQFKMILCDTKSDAHTDANHQYTKSNGCVIEFYVDYSVLSDYVRSMGDISYINGFKGDIIQIQKISD